MKKNHKPAIKPNEVEVKPLTSTSVSISKIPSPKDRLLFDLFSHSVMRFR